MARIIKAALIGVVAMLMASAPAGADGPTAPERCPGPAISIPPNQCVQPWIWPDERPYP
ncbi:hypothetical protein Rhe02_49930 [Rhizocola hellebori]|uniref:Uncharacterized protein n=1 Tax=Rhizocola hellebori TaxID=1392758 RepID=A0A8J3VID0_9ACTN|nr:hypothetical protein [Rhizocola hellebori]GIH06926.1 hypothetical protein Rhe02_49930 [Rhizocola hellebori]